MSLHSKDMEKQDGEKQGVLSHDQIESAVKELANDERALAFTEKEQRAIIRRVDLRLVVTLGCLYLISLLDRTNLGAASVAGFVDSTTSFSDNSLTIP